MGPGDNREAKSLFMERFGDEDSRPPSGARSPASAVADVPLRLTDERFHAEETRLRNFDLRTTSPSPAEDPAASRSFADDARVGVISDSRQELDCSLLDA